MKLILAAVAFFATSAFSQIKEECWTDLGFCQISVIQGNRATIFLPQNVHSMIPQEELKDLAVFNNMEVEVLTESRRIALSAQGYDTEQKPSEVTIGDLAKLGKDEVEVLKAARDCAVTVSGCVTATGTLPGTQVWGYFLAKAICGWAAVECANTKVTYDEWKEKRTAEKAALAGTPGGDPGHGDADSGSVWAGDEFGSPTNHTPCWGEVSTDGGVAVMVPCSQ